MHVFAAESGCGRGFFQIMNHEAPTTKKTLEGSLHHDNVHFAISTMRGRRPNQEDTYLIQTELQVGDSQAQVVPKHSLFAVFDGHGTSFASHYASEHFVSILCNQPTFVEYSSTYQKKISNGSSRSGRAAKECRLESDKEILLLQSAVRATMLTLDAKILEEMISIENNNSESALAKGSFDISDAGTTAIIVILTPNHIICANLGDSRAILQRDEGNLQVTISLSTDHKPSNEAEKSRILKAGGVILSGKVEARLAVSRGLGDFDFKHKPSVLTAAAILDDSESSTPCVDYVKPENQMISPVPEFTTLPRDNTKDKFLIVASDGIWDVLSNEKCSQLMLTIFSEGEESDALACEELLDQCYAKGSLDNMTAILLRFASQQIGCGGGVMKRRKQRKSR